jgi:hypothetical protein
MDKFSRYLLVGAFLSGVLLTALGATMWMKTDYGVASRFFTVPLRIPGKAHYSTWGVVGSAELEPDEWHFHVVFAANRTANVVLSWKMNESILYERTSDMIDEVFNVALPRTSEAWTWDWIIENPHDSALRVDNFTVVHYPIMHPGREVGSVLLSAGIIVVFVVPSIMAYLRRLDMRQK